MSDSVGFQGKIGIGAISAWNDAWSDTGVALVPALDESLSKEIEHVIDAVLEGSAAQRAAERGNTVVSGDINGVMDYNNCDNFLLPVFGAVSSRVWTFTDDLDDAIRIAVEKGVSRWRVGSAKVTSFELSGEAGGSLKWKIGVVGTDFEQSATAFPSVSFTSLNPVMFDHGVLRFGAQDDALASGDRMQFNSFKFSIAENLKTDDYASVTATNADAKTIIEPDRNDVREVTLELEMPRHSADTWVTWKNNFTKLQGDLTFTDGSETLVLELPELIVASGANMETPGRGLRAPSITLRAYQNQDNTPMTAISDEARLTIT